MGRSGTIHRIELAGESVRTSPLCRGSVRQQIRSDSYARIEILTDYRTTEPQCTNRGFRPRLLTLRPPRFRFMESGNANCTKKTINDQRIRPLPLHFFPG